MKKKLILFGVIAATIALGVTGCASFKRGVKDTVSDIGGGLHRTVTVYDYDGNVIKTYEGKIDIGESDGGKVKFDLNGKRTIIYGGIVIVDEE